MRSDEQRRTAKRSPSILVTDARNDSIKGVRAPFAGQSLKKQQQQHIQPPPQNFSHNPPTRRRSNRYTDISIDNILSNSSDIPSGQSRLPPVFPRSSSIEQNPLKKHIRSIPKLSQSLPSRSSKTSQKLVLIPENQQFNRSTSPPLHHQPRLTPPSPPPLPPPPSSQISADLQTQIQRSRAELMTKEMREQEFSRMTAYFICEQFNFDSVSEFLRENHEVKPRMYDEALYVPYSLPLLPGNEGYRIKSNNSAKMAPSKKIMETMITKSELKDHLYEYYSGVETPEDANNYSMDPEQENFENNTRFDPSEPQFFAPEEEEESPHQDSKQKKDQNSSNNTKITASERSQADIYKHHAEMFIFEYGIVVFWNFSEIHEKNILADLAFASVSSNPLLINPINEEEIETEAFHFEYDNNIHRPRLYNDMITLRSGDQLIKLTMSHAIAQSTKLSLFESRMVNILQSIAKLPKKLALTGNLGLKRQQLLKKSGKLFKLRVDVNLQSSILDTPEFFWSSEPALHPLYNAVREYLEIDQRVQVVNDRCKVFLEFVDIVTDSMNEKNTNRITWMIILIIALSLSISVFEFILDMFKA